MALIKCPECGKDVSNQAANCPNCGMPIAEKQPESEEYLACPKCTSKELHAEHKGFSGGKALAGAVLTGGIGLLAGTIGSKDVNITCLKCGNRFKAGEAITIKKRPAVDDLDSRISALLHAGKYVDAIKLYKFITNRSFRGRQSCIITAC